MFAAFKREKALILFSNNVVIFKVGGLDIVVNHSVEKVLIFHLFPRLSKRWMYIVFL